MPCHHCNAVCAGRWYYHHRPVLGLVCDVSPKLGSHILNQLLLHGKHEIGSPLGAVVEYVALQVFATTHFLSADLVCSVGLAASSTASSCSAAACATTGRVVPTGHLADVQYTLFIRKCWKECPTWQSFADKHTYY